MNQEPVISLAHVAKTFAITPSHHRSVLARLTSAHAPRTSITALDDVSLTVNKGEILGICGRNASGKTTLLQVIAGIIRPDSGTMQTQGSIVPLLTLGAGLIEQLNVAENIRLLCLLYGMERNVFEKLFPDIVTFAELDDYLSMRPSQLSRGLVQRLVFSVAVHTHADILLLDEVFATGDAVFRRKAEERLEKFLVDGKTIVLVTHETERIEEVAHRALWMEEGRIVREGSPKEVVEEYLRDCGE